MAISLITGVVGAGIAIYGAVKKAQAEKQAAANLAARPLYNPPNLDPTQLNLAGSMAGYGMSADARQAYQNNADRGLAAETSAILKAGGGANDVGSAYDRYNQANQNVSIYDDQARLQHLQNYQNVLAQYDQNRRGIYDKKYQINQYAPWADKQQLLSQEIAGGQQTFNSGLNMFVSGASQYAKSLGSDGGGGGQMGGGGAGMMGSPMGGGAGGYGGSQGGGNDYGGGGSIFINNDGQPSASPDQIGGQSMQIPSSGTYGNAWGIPDVPRMRPYYPNMN